jgi:hypothetical protein
MEAIMKLFILHPICCILLSILSGCATPYQSQSLTGGYSETQIAPDVYRVQFAGNAYTSWERSQDFAMLRAADLTVNSGFNYFAILDETAYSSVSSITTPGQSNTSGSLYLHGGRGNYYGTYSERTTYKPPQTEYIYKPRNELLIRCFSDKPADIYVFDAAFLQQSIKQKYNIEINR